ncbi:MAG TPA: LysR family transcriptional regulator [Polyangiales bacterium]|nr:LysR family transcriptional regulator [Polyangiales bacterium]
MARDTPRKSNLPEERSASDDLFVSRAIVKLCEVGSFSAVAATLGVSTSAVTRALQRHEDRLGVALFLRSTHGLSPTEAGRRYAEHLERWLCEEDGLRASLNAERRAETGTLRLTVPVFVAERLLLAALQRFAQSHPQVSVDVHASDDNRDLIKEGFDLAIRMGPLAPSNLRTRAVASFRRWVVATPPLARLAHPSELRELPCLVFSVGRTFDQRWEFWSRDGERIEVPVGGALRSNNLELLLQMCCAGLGITRLPDGAVSGPIARGELVQLFPEYTCTPYDTRPTMYAVHAKDPGKDRLREAFIRTLQETAVAQFEGVRQS